MSIIIRSVSFPRPVVSLLKVIPDSSSNLIVLFISSLDLLWLYPKKCIYLRLTASWKFSTQHFVFTSRHSRSTEKGYGSTPVHRLPIFIYRVVWTLPLPLLNALGDSLGYETCDKEPFSSLFRLEPGMN